MRSFCSARHWWIDDTRSTLAGQLIERDAMANLTGTFVAGLVAAMPTTGQHLGAGFGADVVEVDAAFLVALVLGAAAHPVAAFLAPRVIGSGLKLLAFHLLIHVATAALYNGRLVAWRTFSQVTLCDAYVMSTRRTTKQLLTTNGFAYWNRIQAGFAFALDDCLFPTWTGCDDLRRQGTCSTSPWVAKFRTVVISAT